MNEASKVKAAILSLLEGKSVLDLGCGGEKIVPWAVGVDSTAEWVPGTIKPDIVAGIDSPILVTGKAVHEAIRGRIFNVVFSSHALEHMFAPVRDVIAYWLSLVETGGQLILYVPDESYYRFDPSNLALRNPAHHHLLTYSVMRWHLEHLEAIGALSIVELRARNRDTGFPDEYSTLVIARRLR